MSDDTEQQPDFSPSPKAMKALADFAPRLRDPGAGAGAWDEPRSTRLGMLDTPELRAAGISPATRVAVMPHFNPSVLIQEFVRMAYDEGWVASFDWSKWSQTPEGQAIVHDREAIARATPEQLTKVLTAHLRADRFFEGSLEEAFKDGILLAAAERARELLDASR